MTWGQVEAKIAKKGMKILSKHSQDFATDVKASPVVSGDLKKAWRWKPDKTGFSVTNHLVYAPGIFIGAPYGRQVPAGFYPILKATDKRIKEDMKRNLL